MTLHTLPATNRPDSAQPYTWHTLDKYQRSAVRHIYRAARRSHRDSPYDARTHAFAMIAMLLSDRAS